MGGHPKSPKRTHERGAPVNLRVHAALLGGFLAGILPACDNPACVFGTAGCNGAGSGSIGERAASVPVDGEWIASGPPSIQSVLPRATTLADVHTPVAIVFSESMNPLSTSRLSSFERL